MQRRDLLAWSGMVGAASLIPQRLLAGEGGEAAADTKLQDSRPAHKMKLSLAAYSFNRMLPRNWPSPRKGDATMSLLDFIDYSASLNLDACELTSYYFPAEITDEYIAEVKRRTFLQGLDISGTAIGNDFCYPEGETRDEQLQLTRQWIDYAAAMGAPVIRIFAGKQKKGQTFEEAVSQCASGINEAVAYAATKGVCLALENHGGITATPEQMLQIIEQVDESPYFGVNFDSGNFRTDDPYRDLEKIAPLAINAQIKTEVQIAGKRQPADIKRIVDILKDANYRGYVVLEYEEREPLLEIPRYIDQLREWIA
ncbi:MAG: sugar phosphate isomerase/epimerase family protein [Rubinisphaera brasiliensis]|uniref:sugar phosphate isomerase/epimerase family protein n=1 Tax=Rubinisphaera brasiliensis TaxID=119 RepID=UPI00391A17F8